MARYVAVWEVEKCSTCAHIWKCVTCTRKFSYQLEYLHEYLCILCMHVIMWWEVRKVGRENGSYLSPKSTVVSCRAMWSIRSLCYSVLNPCKVVTGIQKQKSANCQHALQWTSAFVHTDVSVAINGQWMDEDRHWTMWELTKHTGISNSLQCFKFYDIT
jgi:hypothetical protein